MQKTYHATNIAAMGEHTSQGIIYQSIRHESKVLDVGCAVGDMGIALQENKHCQVWGIEFDHYRAECAKNTKAYKTVYEFDLNKLTADGLPGLDVKFDFIILGDVLEHVMYPSTVLGHLKSYLKEDGVCMLSLPNIAHCSIKCGLMLNEFKYMPEGFLDESHLRFFTWKSLAPFCTSCGFQIDNCKHTYYGIEGFGNPTNYNLLDPAILRSAFSDLHSFICQYVMRLTRSAMTDNELLQYNQKQLKQSFASIPDEVRQYSASLLARLPSPQTSQSNQGAHPNNNNPSGICISVQGNYPATPISPPTP